MHVCPRDIETMTFDWGSMKWFVTPTRQGEARSSLGERVLGTLRLDGFASCGPELFDSIARMTADIRASG